MGWMNKLKDALKTAQSVAPILAAFGVPGARSVTEAVEMIHLDPGRPDSDAAALVAAAVDSLERRLAVVEKRMGIKAK